jgi:excisionase family DNA binding protein
MTGKLLNFSETKDFLNITTCHIRSLIFKKEIGFIKVGKLIRFSPEDLSKWINSRRVLPSQGGN